MKWYVKLHKSKSYKRRQKFDCGYFIWVGMSLTYIAGKTKDHAKFCSQRPWLSLFFTNVLLQMNLHNHNYWQSSCNQRAELSVLMTFKTYISKHIWIWCQEVFMTQLVNREYAPEGPLGDLEVMGGRVSRRPNLQF